MKEVVELNDLGTEALGRYGYYPVRISVFDHWLSTEEADTCKALNYSDAAGTAALPEYMGGEKRFLTFYERLAENEVIFENFFDKERELMTGRQISPFFLGACVILSLREMSRLDVYFERRAIRAVGGFDRTDLILPESPEGHSYVAHLAQDCGLYVLG